MGDGKARNVRWAGKKVGTTRNAEAFRTPTSQPSPATQEAMPSNTRSLAHATNHDWDEAPYDRGTGKRQISCR